MKSKVKEDNNADTCGINPRRRGVDVKQFVRESGSEDLQRQSCLLRRRGKEARLDEAAVCRGVQPLYAYWRMGHNGPLWTNGRECSAPIIILISGTPARFAIAFVRVKTFNVRNKSGGGHDA